MTRLPRILDIDDVREIVEALANRRRAGQDFETAWPAVLRGAPDWQADELWAHAWTWQQAYERRGGTGIAKLVDVIEERQEREHTAVLG